MSAKDICERKRALLSFEIFSKNTALNFGKERRLSDAHENEERTNTL